MTVSASLKCTNGLSSGGTRFEILKIQLFYSQVILSELVIFFSRVFSAIQCSLDTSLHAGWGYTVNKYSICKGLLDVCW